MHKCILLWTAVVTASVGQPCHDYVCDTLAVRAILDTNGLDTMSVGWYVNVVEGRVAQLDFSRGMHGDRMTDPCGPVYYGPPLRRLPDEIGKLTSLKGLIIPASLGATDTLTISPEVGSLDSLEYLRIYHSPTLLPPEIGLLSSLISLWISDGAVTALPEEMGNLSSLQYLWLCRLELAALPSSFGNLGSLRDLSVYGCGLTWLPESLTGLGAIEEVTVDSNYLCSLSVELQEWLDRYSTPVDWRAGQNCGSAVVPGRRAGAGAQTPRARRAGHALGSYSLCGARLPQDRADLRRGVRVLAHKGLTPRLEVVPW
jgi:hypothetical protein